jgi:hypothetical protein
MPISLNLLELNDICKSVLVIEIRDFFQNHLVRELCPSSGIPYGGQTPEPQ